MLLKYIHRFFYSYLYDANIKLDNTEYLDCPEEFLKLLKNEIQKIKYIC